MSTASQALGTLLWSSVVFTDDGDTPADEFDASQSLVSLIQAEWDSFCDSLPEDFDPEEACLRPISEPGWDAWDQVAHDWILTRNGHGCGFWETSDWAEPWSSLLTKLAQSKPAIEVFLDDQSEVSSVF